MLGTEGRGDSIRTAVVGSGEGSGSIVVTQRAVVVALPPGNRGQVQAAVVCIAALGDEGLSRPPGKGRRGRIDNHRIGIGPVDAAGG